MGATDLADDRLSIPTEWEHLPLEQWQSKPVLLLGATDTGKSSLGRYLFERLQAASAPTAYLDLDPGQNSLGPPTTIGLGVPYPTERQFPPSGRRWLYFTGNNTPRGQLLRHLEGLHILHRLAWNQGCRHLLVNSSGFIDPEQGGQALKWAVIDQLRPCVIIGLQRNAEMASLLAPVSRLPDVSVIQLKASPAVTRRSQTQRRDNRAESYRRYFRSAQRYNFYYRSIAVFPRPRFTPGQLVAIEENNGLAVAVAVVTEVEPERGVVTLFSPIDPSQHAITAIRLGAVRLHLDTWQDSPV